MNKKIVALVALFAALIPFLALAQDTGEGTTTPIDALSDYALWAIIGGAALTYVSALINKLHWPDYYRFGTFFVFSLVYAGADAYFARTLNFDNWSRAALLTVASGITFYNLNKGAVRDFEAATGGDMAP